MVDDWITTTLGDFASLQRGHDLPEPARNPGDVPAMGSFGITGSHSVSSARSPGVTVGRSGASIGVVSYIDCDYWPLNTCLYVTDFHGNNPSFVYNFLKTLDLASFNSGSAQPSLNRNDIYPVEIDVPQRTEQDAIATLLRALGDKIELNRQTNETLEALARALFKDWFVDFGSTRTKAEGGAPYLAPELWALFPGALDDEDKPVWWSLCEIGKLAASVQNGGTSARRNESFWLEGTVDWFKTGELSDQFLIAAEEKITEAGLRKIGGKLWPAGTILFAIYASPTVGRMGILTAPSSANQACCALQAKDEIGVPFLFQALREARGDLQNIAIGAAQQNISQKPLLAYKSVFPGLELSLTYSTTADPIFAKMQHLQEESRTLAQTRDLLLPKLMSGKIRLRDAEREVEAVL
nr:restriction endonuclease subunit S [Halochromatium glycolicum]